jgi:FtsH-binding integral membrane protein
MSNPSSAASQPAFGAVSAQAEQITAFLRKVYGWMFLGLALTAVVAFGAAGSPAVVQAVLGNRLIFFGLIIAELALVWYLSARVSQLAPATAGSLFLLYSALNGITLSVILLAFTGASVANAFITTSVMFGALAVYGSVTKRSLAGVGQFAFMGLVGIIVASIVGIFWQNSMLQFVVSVAGVVAFTGLTMWDAQRLKEMALHVEGGSAASHAIVGALALYLDFINLFLFVLRLFGRRR